MASTRILTDYSEMVTVGEDDHGDIRLSLYSVLQGEPATRTDEVVLRPTQAERLAAELLAYANGDHKLPPDAVRPQRIVVGTDEPETTEAEIDNIKQYLRQIADPSYVGSYDDTTVIEMYRMWAKAALDA